MNKFAAKRLLHFEAWPGDVLALLAGSLLIFAFAPFNFFPLAIISPAVLLACWFPLSPKHAFWRGWLFGIGFFTAGVYWVFISIHQYGNAPNWLAGLITGLFIAVLALFPAFNGYLLNRFFKKHILLAFSALWVALEWVRSWIFTGFPWLFLGDSQLNSFLKNYAPFLSVYGVSLAVVLCSTLLVLAFSRAHRTKSIAAIIFIWVLGWSLSLITWTHTIGNPIQVSLIQGNIAQEMKWVPEHVQASLDLYQKLTEQHWNSNVIIWPETAVPLSLQGAEDFIGVLMDEASKNHSAIIAGIPIDTPTHQGFYNAVITLGDGTGVYVKKHLVPFGEFTPLQEYVGKIFNFFDIPMSEIVTSPIKTDLIKINNTRIATFICYEIAFPEQVLAQGKDANLLLTVTNDAWFGHSIAQAQHLAISRMRALEMGRPVLMVSNNGLTAFITAAGKVESIAPPYQTAVLTHAVQPMQGETPWQRFGMNSILLILISMLIIARYL